MLDIFLLQAFSRLHIISCRRDSSGLLLIKNVERAPCRRSDPISCNCYSECLPEYRERNNYTRSLSNVSCEEPARWIPPLNYMPSSTFCLAGFVKSKAIISGMGDKYTIFFLVFALKCFQYTLQWCRHVWITASDVRYELSMGSALFGSRQLAVSWYVSSIRFQLARSPALIRSW